MGFDGGCSDQRQRAELGAPRRSQRRVGMIAEAQREPDSVLHRVEIRRVPHPYLPGRGAAHGLNVGDGFLLAIRGPRRALVDGHLSDFFWV